MKTTETAQTKLNVVNVRPPLGQEQRKDAAQRKRVEVIRILAGHYEDGTLFEEKRRDSSLRSE